MKIAALLTCYNRIETTLRCLNQLVDQQLPKDCFVDIYLVDDASPDQTGKRILEWFSGVSTSKFTLRVVQSPGNLFWCKGMRLAWDTAIASGKDYDYWLWLNDDVQFVDGAINSVISDSDIVLNHGGKAGIIVGTFVPSPEDNQATYGLCDADGKVLQPCGVPMWKDGELMNGNLVLVPKEVYEKVGPIFGGYNHGYADSDYRLMCKENGYKAYASSMISGVCPREPERYVEIVGLSLSQRVRALFNPKGKSLHDTFVYRYRHWGVARALLSVAHVTIYALLGRKIEARCK